MCPDGTGRRANQVTNSQSVNVFKTAKGSMRRISTLSIWKYIWSFRTCSYTFVYWKRSLLQWHARNEKRLNFNISTANNCKILSCRISHCTYSKKKYDDSNLFISEVTVLWGSYRMSEKSAINGKCSLCLFVLGQLSTMTQTYKL
jgi:hypothetical protein